MSDRPETFIDNSYYKNDNTFIEFKSALDWEVYKFIANLLFDGDMQKVKYASNAHAFRARSDDQGGNLQLPFVNFRTSSNGVSFDNSWNMYTAPLRSSGIWIPEIGSSLRLMPVELSYEATFWCSMEHELQVAAQRLIFNKYDNVGIPFEVNVNGQDMKFSARITNDDRGIDWDSEFNESDWLEQNQIRNIGFDFDIMTYMPQLPTDLAFSVTETAILEFASAHGIDNVTEDDFVKYFMQAV